MGESLLNVAYRSVRGSIVNVASIAGVMGSPHLGPYVASKHAATGITKCDAITYGPIGIRINTVSPG
jgi:NAD(P)-dependent dehydrogenase (short-subunit alcohol dehydrogenase family)